MVTLDPMLLAHRWADELPGDFARRLAVALRDGATALRALQQTAVLPISSDAARQALELIADGQGPFTSGLLTALLELQPRQPVIIPVWTGPDSQQSGGRLTIAVLADLISEAEREILLVSYATLPSVEIRRALTDAVERGVEITTLLERPGDNAHFSGHGDPLAGLRMRRLFWPENIRPPGASMHAKMLIVDRQVAVIGSANLTGHALERNIECGLLVRGGAVPGALANHLLNIHDLQTSS